MILALIISFVIPFVYVVIGLISLLNPPKKINGFVGYRTQRAMQNEETWKYAHNLSGKLFLVLGMLLTVLTIIFDIIGIKAGEDAYAVIIILLVCLQSIAIAFVIMKTEQGLKKKFSK